MKNLFKNNLVLVCIFLSLFYISEVKSQQTLTQINGWNAYVHLPASYNSNNNTYPTIIFFPGIGEVGTNAGAVIANGPGAYLSQGWDGKVQVDGNTVEFIVISVQPPSGFPNEWFLNERIETIKSQYRVNLNKLYLTGLSMGGWCSTTYVTGDAYGGPYTYASKIAAVVTVQGMRPDDNQPYPALFDNYASVGGRYLGFEQMYDGRDTKTVVDRMNSTKPGSAIHVKTNFGGGGHCCWNQFYGGQGVQPGVFMLDGKNQNMYEWMARQSFGVQVTSLPPAPVIIPPSLTVSANQTITLPTSTATISGTVTIGSSSIASYSWSKVSGPAGGSISNTTTAAATISSLQEGSYTYQLKVTDNSGLSVTANTTINVNAAAQPTAGPCNTSAPVTYTLSQTGPGEIYRPNGSAWKGGDTIKITGTNYSVIEFFNVGGDPCRPLIIMPMTTVTTPVFRLKGDCRYIKIWGGNTKYGIKVANGALAINLSHHIEVDNVECYGANVGVYCKTDVVYDDKKTWYPNYPMTKFTFKNMYIHDVSGEGMYIGMTQVSGLTVKSSFSGLDTTIIPNRMDSVEISNCIVERAQWDGIQLSNARNGNKIFNNIVRDYGTLNLSSQQAGILMGGNSNGDIYNNTVVKGTGNGIQVFGYGVINIYNNTLDSCGNDGKTNSNGTQGQQTIYANDYINTVEANPKQTINIYGNVINRPKTSGGVFIAGYSNNSLPSAVYNNLFCIPSAASDWQNIYIKTYVAGTTNTNNTLNCVGSPANIAPVAIAGVAQTVTLPTNFTTLTGSGTDADGTVVSYKWAQISGPIQSTIVSPNSATTVVNNLAEGVYQFELTVTDNGGASGKNTVSVSVLAGAEVALLPAVNPANTVNGLDYKYYEGSWNNVPNFTTLTPVKTGTINNFDITVANRGDQFGFSFTGFITVPADGVYTFFTTSDDGSMLYIDGVLTVNNDGLHAALEKSGTIGLKAGKHAITGLFFELGGGEVFTVSYSGSGISKQQIPQSILFRVSEPPAVTLLPAVNPANTVNGLDYKYYEGSWNNVPNFTALTPVKTGTINNFDITVANRGDQFGFSFTGFITVPADGVYTFFTTSDDGSLLYIDGVLTVNNDGLHGAIEKSGTIGLKAGKHAITGLFFELGGGEVFTVSYSGSGISKQQIPQSILFRVSEPPAVTLLPAVNPANTLNGLDYKYYEGSWNNVPNFTALTPVKTGTINNFDITVANRGDQFGFSFTGFITVPADGVYTFFTTSDDGSMLYIDGVLTVNNDGLHGAIEKSGTIGLKAGKHAIAGLFFEQSGGEVFNVKYEGMGIAKQLIPSSALFRETNTPTTTLLPAVYPANTVNGLDYKYYEGTWSSVPNFAALAPVKTSTVNNFYISVANAGNLFGISFTGYISVPTDGQYTFYTTSDDGSMIYIDGVLVVNNDGLHAAQERSGTIGLQAGKHRITAQYFDQFGSHVFYVGYEGMGLSKQLVPTSVLFRDAVSSFASGTTTGNAAANAVSDGETAVKTNALIAIENAATVYPNPFTSAFKVQLNDQPASIYTLVLSDMSGKRILQKRITKPAGAFVEHIQVANLAPGTYILQIINANGTKTTHKLVKN